MSFSLSDPAPSHPLPSLYVGGDAEFFVVGSGVRVDLRQLGAIRRIFRTLVHVRGAAPGRAVSITDLYQAAWSGEAAECTSLGGPRGRVYTVISKLRRMGLAPLIQRTESGYCLNPACKVVIEGAGEPAETAPLPAPEPSTPALA